MSDRRKNLTRVPRETRSVTVFLDKDSTQGVLLRETGLLGPLQLVTWTMEVRSWCGMGSGSPSDFC